MRLNLVFLTWTSFIFFQKSLADPIHNVYLSPNIARPVNNFSELTATTVDHALSPSQSTFSYQLYSKDIFNEFDYPKSCIAALSAQIRCDNMTREFQVHVYRGSLGNDSATRTVCDPTCGVSLKNWFTSVQHSCKGKKIGNFPAEAMGGYIWAGWNETCLKDRATEDYCNDIIDRFPIVDSIQQMDKKDACSFCYVERHEMMRRTSYSVYDDFYESQLENVHKICGLSGPTTPPPPLVAGEQTQLVFCASGKQYVTEQGDTCDSIATANNLPSAGLFIANQQLFRDCGAIPSGLKLCLPLTCPKVYAVQDFDTCVSIETSQGLVIGDVRKYNGWVSLGCGNLALGIKNYGRIICLGPQGGQHTGTAPVDLPTPSQRNT